MVTLLGRVLCAALLLRLVGAFPGGANQIAEPASAVRPSAAPIDSTDDSPSSDGFESEDDPEVQVCIDWQAAPCPPELGASVRSVLRVTAYCDRGITASGVPSGEGQCAAPAWIPFGTRVYVPAMDRWFVVTDRTALRFRHNTVDLFMTSYDECILFGRHYLECRFYLPSHPFRYNSAGLWQMVGSAGS